MKLKGFRQEKGEVHEWGSWRDMSAGILSFWFGWCWGVGGLGDCYRVIWVMLVTCSFVFGGTGQFGWCLFVRSM